MPKRVWCLYRVSTKSQVNSDEDIPMQKKACENFARKQLDWKITNELFERGVSGWKKRADERDALNTIRNAAIDKEFDVLLVFMMDRLGRRDDETPFVINFLHQQGVEVWSVQEGQRKLDSHVDKLINYISSWQSSGESIKTSLRARESKKQLSEQGFFQGGKAPYGFTVVETDQPHWKDKDRFIKILLPDEHESKIVRLVFSLYTDKHYGYRKIVEHLNSNGYRNRNDSLFRVNLIQRILDNPIFIGRKRYKSYDGQDGDTQPYNENLRVVSDEVFYKAQEIKNKRKESINSQDKTGIPKSGKLMFSGMAYCNYCGSKLSGNYLYRKNQKPHKRTEYYTTTIYRYRCPLNKGKSAENHEKNIWGSKTIDEKIISDIKDILDSLNIEDFIDKSVDKKKEIITLKEKSLDQLTKEKQNNDNQLKKLNSEIANSLMGESSFSPEQLSAAIEGIKNENESIEIKIKNLSNEIEMEKNNHTDIKDMAEELRNWSEKFDKADNDLKKAMLFRVVDKVYLKKNDAIIEFNIKIREIVEAIEGEVELK